MSTVSTTPHGTAVARSTRLLRDGAVVIVVVTVIIAVVAAIAIPRFATASNIRALLLSVALTGIIAVGLSLITIVGRIFSLSIAATAAVSTIVFAAVLPAGGWLALLLTVAFGTVLGAVQGAVIGRLRTDPIITTIAFAAVFTGIGQLATGGLTVSRGGDASMFDTNLLGVLPFQVLVFILVTAAVSWWHRYSIPGRLITLVGLNERAATIVGVRAWPAVLLSFAIAGAATGLAGALLSSQSGQGNLNLGSSYGFDAVTAVVVGGISVKGGAGSPISAAVGALFVGLLGNVLVLAGLSYETQLVVKGVLVLLAVAATGVAGNLRGGKRS